MPIETRSGQIEATARQASVRESHSRICNPKHGANETRRVLIETRRVPIEATARRRQASVFGKPFPPSAIGSTEQTFSSECQTGNAPPSQLQCRHEGRQAWLHAKQSTPPCEPQGPGRERRPKWRLPQCSQLPVRTQNDQFFCFSRRMRASVVIFRTLAQERCRSAAGNLPKSKADAARSNRRSLECEGSGKGGRYARWATSRAIRASKIGSKESHPPKKTSEQKKPDDSATFRCENIEKPRSHTHKISES